MNFKKMFCALVALAVTPMVFAGNTSDLAVALDNFSSREPAIQQDDDPTYESELNKFFAGVQEVLPQQTQKDKDTDNAIKAGLLKLFNDDEAGNLNENEQAIISTLFQEIPAAGVELEELSQNKNATLGELEAKYKEVSDTINKLFGQAAGKIINNQTEITADKVNMERATQVTSLFYTTVVTQIALSEMGAGLE